MSNDPLHGLRLNIDDIDVQIVTLLNKRAEAALQIGHAKTELNKKVYDPNREKAVLDKIDQLNKGPLPNGSVEDIYAAIITACREIQLR